MERVNVGVVVAAVVAGLIAYILSSTLIGSLLGPAQVATEGASTFESGEVSTISPDLASSIQVNRGRSISPDLPVSQALADAEGEVSDSVGLTVLVTLLPIVVASSAILMVVVFMGKP